MKMNVDKRIAIATFMIVLVVGMTLQSKLTVSSKELKVPEEYTSIQEAIDAASDGDTVKVGPGQYNESITVDKSLNLVGEDRETTIIDGNRSRTIILVEANNVNISGFTIQNSLNNIAPVSGILGHAEPAGGIGLNGSLGCTISNNTIQGCAAAIAICAGSGNTTVSNNLIVPGNYFGINLFGVVSNTLSSPVGGNKIINNTIAYYNGVYIIKGENNEITGNWLNCSDCIHLGYPLSYRDVIDRYSDRSLDPQWIQPAGNNVISSNTIIGRTSGILALASDGNTISNNTITAGGIYLKECNNTSLRDNNLSSFGVDGSGLSHFLHDIDTSNTVNGRPVLYLINQSNLLIDLFTYPSIGYLGLVNSWNIRLWRLTITNNTQGLMLAQTSKCEIDEVHLSNNADGIYLWNCSESTIMGSTITLSKIGIHMKLCKKNVIRGNTLSDNDDGIRLNGSSDNTFHRNNFIDSRLNLKDDLYNAWDDRNSEPYKCPKCGQPRPVGNYWSDYAGKDDGSHTQAHNCDGDGVGDTLLPHQAVDSYPLMNPWMPLLGDLDYNGIVNILDLAKAAKNFLKTSP